MNEALIQIKHLEPYFKIAEQEAKKSPCTRRQYGALIATAYASDLDYTVRHNARVTHCCNNVCVRDALGLVNGQNVEAGAEVHAETAALIDHGGKQGSNDMFLLVGFKGAHELLWEDVWPCRTCALNIKYAGFRYIYVRSRMKTITPVSVAEIIEHREKEWESDI